MPNTLSTAQQTYDLKQKILSLSSATYRVRFFITEQSLAKNITDLAATVLRGASELIDNNAALNNNSGKAFTLDSLQQNISVLTNFFDVAGDLASFGFLRSNNLVLRKENFIVLKNSYLALPKLIAEYQEMQMHTDVHNEVEKILATVENFSGEITAEKTSAKQKKLAKPEIGFLPENIFSAGDEKAGRKNNSSAATNAVKKSNSVAGNNPKQKTAAQVSGKSKKPEKKEPELSDHSLRKEQTFKKIIAVLSVNKMTAEALGKKVRCDRRTIIRYLNAMQEQQIVGKEKAARKMLYFIAPAHSTQS